MLCKEISWFLFLTPENMCLKGIQWTVCVCVVSSLMLWKPAASLDLNGPFDVLCHKFLTDPFVVCSLRKVYFSELYSCVNYQFFKWRSSLWNISCCVDIFKPSCWLIYSVRITKVMSLFWTIFFINIHDNVSGLLLSSWSGCLMC